MDSSKICIENFFVKNVQKSIWSKEITQLILWIGQEKGSFENYSLEMSYDKEILLYRAIELMIYYQNYINSPNFCNLQKSDLSNFVNLEVVNLCREN